MSKSVDDRVTGTEVMLLVQRVRTVVLSQTPGLPQRRQRTGPPRSMPEYPGNQAPGNATPKRNL